MIQSPINNLIVKIATKYIRNITDILRLAHIENSKVNPADCVQITGEIVSLPKAIMKRMDYDGFSTKDVRVGDTAIFRYDVVFSFLRQPESDNPIYKNEFWYKGESYWSCDILKLFGVIRNDKIIMVNGYCMIEGMSKPTLIVLPRAMKRLVQAATATLTQIGNNVTTAKRIDTEVGDKVFYNPGIVQEYQINNKHFGIIRQKDIFGRTVATYEDLQILN